MDSIKLKYIALIIILLKLLLISYFIFVLLPEAKWADINFKTFSFFISAGFIAQIIDGALGMAYGVSCSALLLNLGVSPRLASASVHTAEVFTTGVSGLSHLSFKNIDKTLFFRITITGVIGAVIGAFIISNLVSGDVIKPYISSYLLVLGIVILYKGIKNAEKKSQRVKMAEGLALFGGFMDAVGGGGWGPIVTSNIISQGKNPKETIGTVNTAEFFVSYFSTGVFIFFVGIESWHIILGLITGGVIAAPIGAYLAHKANKRILMILVGLLIIITSFYTLSKYI